MAWTPTITDDFTGTNGNPPNPALWNVVDTGSGSVTIQSNALDMVADGVDAASNEVGLAAIMTGANGLRIDSDIVIPGSTVVFFHTYHVRHAANGDHYYVMVARLSSGVDPIVRIAKSIGGTNTTLSAADFTLTNAVTHYRVRAWINGFQIRGAVRDFAAGAIPEGVFDIEATDAAQDIAGVGIAQINTTVSLGGGIQTVTVDNVVVSQFTPPLWSPVLTDEFTGTDNDPWDVAKWATYAAGTGTAEADIQSNQGRLLGDVDAVGGADIRASAIIPSPLADIRVEYEVTFPADDASGHFFHNVEIRFPHTTSPPTPEPDHYKIQIQRTSTGNPPAWRLRRTVSETTVDLSSPVDLTNAELTYRVRLEVQGSTVRVVVRQLSAGPIAEGVWDVEVVDTQVTQAGTTRLGHTPRVASGVDNAVLVDNVVISELLTQTSVAPIFLHQARMRAAA